MIAANGMRNNIMKIRTGFIGLGMMGLPMLENLARRGDLEIHAHDVSDLPFERLARVAGWGTALTRAPRLQDLSACTVVITMLPNSRITTRTILGDGDAAGLADILPTGATIVDMGSSDPAETLRLLPLLAERGLSLIDAPVSGGAAKAQSGQLSIMIGGTPETVETLRPLLSRMGRTLIAAGQPGAAHAMKALNNYVYAAGLLATAEATAIAERMGLDTAIFADVLNSSSGRNVATETKLKQFILPRDYSGGFALRLQAKDLALAEGLQALAGVDAPQLALCAGLWARASAALPDDADNTEIHRFILDRTPGPGKQD